MRGDRLVGEVTVSSEPQSSRGGLSGRCADSVGVHVEADRTLVIDHDAEAVRAWQSACDECQVVEVGR